jgi:hypothetical protein
MAGAELVYLLLREIEAGLILEARKSGKKVTGRAHKQRK